MLSVVGAARVCDGMCRVAFFSALPCRYIRERHGPVGVSRLPEGHESATARCMRPPLSFAAWAFLSAVLVLLTTPSFPAYRPIFVRALRGRQVQPDGPGGELPDLPSWHLLVERERLMHVVSSR